YCARVHRRLDRNDRLHSYPQGRDREDRERNHRIFGERDVEGLRPHDRHVHQGLQVRRRIACDPQTVVRRSQALGHPARHVNALYRGFPAEITVAAGRHHKPAASIKSANPAELLAIWQNRHGGNFALGLFGAAHGIQVKILLSFVLLLVFVARSAATDFTYQEYTKEPEVWKRGFVFGISRYMSTVAQSDEEAPYPVRTAFQRCLASSTDTLLVREVEAYVAANPTSSKGPMVQIIMRAFFNLCRAEIEKAQSPKGAPSQR